MKLHLDRAIGKNAITAYSELGVTVNSTIFGPPTYSGIIVPDEGEVTVLPNFRFESIDELLLVELLDRAPEVILIGTGATQRFIHPRVGAIALNRRIGVDCMTTAAVCRTFNILVGEGRRCTALILF